MSQFITPRHIDTKLSKHAFKSWEFFFKLSLLTVAWQGHLGVADREDCDRPKRSWKYYGISKVFTRFPLLSLPPNLSRFPGDWGKEVLVRNSFKKIWDPGPPFKRPNVSVRWMLVVYHSFKTPKRNRKNDHEHFFVFNPLPRQYNSSINFFF